MDVGYGADDPALLLDPLEVLPALDHQRDHRRADPLPTGMTEDEAVALMVDGGFQEEAEARAKFDRARLSSTQLSTYFAGLDGDVGHRARGRAGGPRSRPGDPRGATRSPSRASSAASARRPGFRYRPHLEAVIGPRLAADLAPPADPARVARPSGRGPARGLRRPRPRRRGASAPVAARVPRAAGRRGSRRPRPRRRDAPRRARWPRLPGRPALDRVEPDGPAQQVARSRSRSSHSTPSQVLTPIAVADDVARQPRARGGGRSAVPRRAHGSSTAGAGPAAPGPGRRSPTRRLVEPGVAQARRRATGGSRSSSYQARLVAATSAPGASSPIRRQREPGEQRRPVAPSSPWRRRRPASSGSRRRRRSRPPRPRPRPRRHPDECPRGSLRTGRDRAGSPSTPVASATAARNAASRRSSSSSCVASWPAIERPRPSGRRRRSPGTARGPARAGARAAPRRATGHAAPPSRAGEPAPTGRRRRRRTSRNSQKTCAP